MTKEEAIKFLQQIYPNGGHCWLDEQRIEAIGMAEKALQEEPVSKDLEEEIEEYWKNAPTGTVYFPMWEHFQIIAHHFAEWGKKQAEIEIQAQSMALAHGCPK